MKKILAAILTLTVLLLTLCACGTNNSGNANETSSSESITITVDIVDDKGETETFTISTVSTTLRGALEQEQLISGEEGPYGLYVKTVNGLTADYDTDNSYWSFNKDGTYLSTSVDDTIISDGEHYEIIYTK